MNFGPGTWSKWWQTDLKLQWNDQIVPSFLLCRKCFLRNQWPVKEAFIFTSVLFNQNPFSRCFMLHIWRVACKQCSEKRRANYRKRLDQYPAERAVLERVFACAGVRAQLLQMGQRLMTRTRRTYTLRERPGLNSVVHGHRKWFILTFQAKTTTCNVLHASLDQLNGLKMDGKTLNRTHHQKGTFPIISRNISRNYYG